MRGISDTIARLTAAAARTASYSDNITTSLSALKSFGSNPGALGAFVHVPPGLPADAPLVVVLHGCTQTASGYDHASGWSQLADREGFALLYPEQKRSNNANGCFNWFEPGDIRRDVGEALSIRQMIAAMQDRHGIDPGRIFITGLSAGGAMTATMLSTYPELFAGGGIIAGLPHGITNGMVQAFDRMRGHALPSTDALQAALRNASSHHGRWPRLSIWHGSADATVSERNADAIVAQWRGVHGLADKPTRTEAVGPVSHRSWAALDGRVMLEDYRISGMAHGTPLKTTGADALGSPAPYMLDAGISSTLRIARFWEIAGAAPARAKPIDQLRSEETTLPMRPEPRRLHGERIEPQPSGSVSGVGKLIEDALRAAGLMK